MTLFPLGNFVLVTALCFSEVYLRGITEGDLYQQGVKIIGRSATHVVEALPVLCHPLGEAVRS